MLHLRRRRWWFLGRCPERLCSLGNRTPCRADEVSDNTRHSALAEAHRWRIFSMSCGSNSNLLSKNIADTVAYLRL
jgi:hypothetical protein